MPTALDEYLEELSPWTGYDLGVDVDAMADGDGAATVTYAMASLGEAWGALPEELRGLALTALQELAAAAGALAENAALEIVSAVSEGFEDAGPIVKFIKQIIFLGIDLAQTVNQINTGYSQSSRAMARKRTLGAYDDDPPLFSRRNIEGYPQWVFGDRGTIRWAWVSCFVPDDGEARAFGETLIKPSGKWEKKNGVALHCPTFQSGEGTWGGCSVHPAGNQSDRFNGAIFLNALSWPFIAPNLPAAPLQVAGLDPDHPVDPNESLIRYQMMMMLDATTNLRAPIGRIQRFAKALGTWWKHQTQDQFVGRIDAAGYSIGPHEGRYTPDLEWDDDHKPTTWGKRFYFDSDGLIRIYTGYEGEQLDLATFGLRAPRRGLGRAIAISIASFNTVISTALSACTFRESILLDSRRCAAIVEDGLVPSLSQDVRAAVQESAAMFSKGGESPRRPRRTREVKRPTRMGFGKEDDGGGGLILGAAALAAFFALK